MSGSLDPENSACTCPRTLDVGSYPESSDLGLRLIFLHQHSRMVCISPDELGWKGLNPPVSGLLLYFRIGWGWMRLRVYHESLARKKYRRTQTQENVAINMVQETE